MERQDQAEEGRFGYFTYSGKSACVSCGNWSQELLVHVKIHWKRARLILSKISITVAPFWREMSQEIFLRCFTCYQTSQEDQSLRGLCEKSRDELFFRSVIISPSCRSHLFHMENDFHVSLPLCFPSACLPCLSSSLLFGHTDRNPPFRNGLKSHKLTSVFTQ